jgi:two-component system response regulator PilR (NtrC family)
MQVKLLRVLQEGRVRPVGGQEEIPFETRILSATHQNLAELVHKQLFRQDLFYRIHVIELFVPPLRERQEDILALCEHYLNKLAHQQKCAPRTLHVAAQQALQQYPFPGNIRELENILERASALAVGQIISLEDLQLPQLSFPAHTPTIISAVQEDLDQRLSHQERESIIAALERTRWNRVKAAELLGLTPRMLRYRMKKLGIG